VAIVVQGNGQTPTTGETKMSMQILKYSVYANGIFWGEFEGTSEQDAMEVAATLHGTPYIDDDGDECPDTTGMTAVEIDA